MLSILISEILPREDPDHGDRLAFPFEDNTIIADPEPVELFIPSELLQVLAVGLRVCL